MTQSVVISGTGEFIPTDVISNDELVASFNQYVETFNQGHAKEIAAGDMTALKPSSSDFIEKVSGIKRRHVLSKAPILDPDVMQPVFQTHADEALSIQAEMAMKAADMALENANADAKDVDLVIVACSNFQRAYPAIAIEVQYALGAQGSAYDLNVACSSATFGLRNAFLAVQTGAARSVLVISPEICTAHLNFRDRDSHFIFGDACSAVLVEAAGFSKSENQFEMIDVATKTLFSNNIRNNLGFLSKTESDVLEDSHNIFSKDRLFVQQGRRVFKDVVPLVTDMLSNHLRLNHINAADIKRFWLHQANANMNRLVLEKLLGHKEIGSDLAPVILDEYANTSSPGCILAFHQHQENFTTGDYGLLCSFGAGYSAGSVIVKKV
jgi:beta-ketodecanoyl-[acyl-carrier-protein] synthase